MATEVDLQRLVVQMEASFVKYQREWSKALGVTDNNVKRVQQRFDGMTKSINNAGANTGRALSPVSMQTSNIAAQFQDIAVQLQAGQSPFLIAMQQGTQLSAVLNQAKSPIAALSAGFLQMVNPISLATIAAIALGGAAVQYLGTLLGDGRSATEVIKEQNDVIRRVAENWGDAVPALKAYVDELDRASDQSDLNQAYDTVIAQQFAALKAQLPDLRGELVQARGDLQNFGSSVEEISALQAAFDDLSRRIEDGTADGNDLNRVLDVLASTTGTETVPSLVNLQDTLSGVARALSIAANAASRFRAEQAAVANRRAGQDLRERYATSEFIADQTRINSLTADQLALENEIARVKAEAERSDTLISDQQALEIAQGRLDAEERRSQLASAGRSSEKREDRERQAVLDLIAALEYERSTIGMTEQQKAVANALRQAGAAATNAQREAIIGLVNATYAEQQALEGATEQMREFADAGRAALSGYIQDMISGKDATEALGNALANIGNRLLNLGLDSLFGTGGSDFGAIGKLLQLPGRAAGGPVRKGQPYIVGEKRAEVFVPDQNGTIVPEVPRLPNLQRGGAAGPSISMPITIDATGADAAGLARVSQQVAKLRAEMPGIVRKAYEGRQKNKTR